MVTVIFLLRKCKKENVVCRTEVRPQGLLGRPVRDPECGDTRHLGRKRAVMPSSLPHCRVDDKMSSTMRAQPAPSIHGETLNEVREGPAPRSMSRRRVVEEAGTQRVDLTPQSNGYVPVLPKGRFKPDWNQLLGVHEGEVIEMRASSGPQRRSRLSPSGGICGLVLCAACSNFQRVRSSPPERFVQA